MSHVMRKPILAYEGQGPAVLAAGAGWVGYVLQDCRFLMLRRLGYKGIIL